MKKLLVAGALALTVLATGCSTTDSANENAATSVDDTQWYCLDENSNVVDEDYCEPDESEYDPNLYYLWLGPMGVYTPGQHLSDSHSSRAHASRSTAPTARPTQSSRPSSARPSSGSSRPQGGSARPQQQQTRPQAPAAPARPAPPASPPRR